MMIFSLTLQIFGEFFSGDEAKSLDEEVGEARKELTGSVLGERVLTAFITAETLGALFRTVIVCSSGI